MVQAILITGWRNDTGAYLLDSFPSGVNVDGQDLMNLYNLHRFRDTKANFQVIISSNIRLCSFYSGGYDSPYVGRPNYGVALLLDAGENPDLYENPLRKITNNLLIHLDDDDFQRYFENIFNLVREKRFDEIKIERGKVSASTPRAIETTSTIGAKIKTNEEKDIFDDLIATVGDDFNLGDDDGDDLFGGSSSSGPSADDPFGTGSGDPFSKAQEDLFSPSEAGDPFKKFAESTPKAKKTKTVSTSKLMMDLQSLDERMPKAPADQSSEKMVQYLENKVNFLERKISVLSQIANTLQAKDKEIEEKDDLIAKLLLLLS